MWVQKAFNARRGKEENFVSGNVELPKLENIKTNI